TLANAIRITDTFIGNLSRSCFTAGKVIIGLYPSPCSCFDDLTQYGLQLTNGFRFGYGLAKRLRLYLAYDFAVFFYRTYQIRLHQLAIIGYGIIYHTGVQGCDQAFITIGYPGKRSRLVPG